jgi:hypothetical protein
VIAPSPLAVVDSPAVGTEPAAQYAESGLTMEPGSRLIGFTEGLIRRRGSDPDLREFLRSLGTATTRGPLPLDALADEVLSCAPDGLPTDDVAVLALGFDHRA